MQLFRRGARSEYTHDLMQMYPLCLLLDETLKLLNELTSRRSLQVPNIYYHLPHLLKNEGSLRPSVHVGLGRTGGKLAKSI